MFHWGDVPLTDAQAQVAATLTYSQHQLLEHAPPTGRYTIPALVVAALETNQTLDQLQEDLDAVRPLGVDGPKNDDTYISLSWGELLRSSITRPTD